MFIDYKKAFYLIDHNILLSKLGSFYIAPKELALFENYLKVRTQFVNPLARRKAPADGRRPEGANIDRRLVPYHAKCMRFQSHIEFIYLYIYIYASTVVLMRAALEFWPW